MSPVHVREKPPLRHMIDVRAPAGRHYRLGEDEPDPANVFSGLRYGDTMPGGFETADCTLPREPGVEYPDLELLSDWRVLGVGGEVYWEGRLERAPRTSGDEVSVSPSAVGYQAALDDDKSCRVIYVDRGLGQWRGPGRERRLSATTIAWLDHTVDPDPFSDLPALGMAAHGPWDASAGFRIEACYDSGALGISSLTAVHRVSANVDLTNVNWSLVIYATNDEGTYTSLDSLRTLIPVSPATLTRTTVNSSSYAREILVQFGYVVPGGAEVDYIWWLDSVAVFGTHGLTQRGTAPNAGFYASDIVTHAVQAFTQLNIKADSVQQSSFIIPHLVFLEPTTCSEIVRQASRFNLPDWAVWDDREFVWHQPGARGRTWRLRIGPSQLEEAGPQADRLWESVFVTYQDVDGATKMVGPPGSGADVESSDLKDSDPDNPANRLGITRRDILQMGVSTAAGATEVGRQFLEQSKLVDRSGKARVVGWAEDDRGVLHPFAAIRSGDYAVFVDAADTSARKIVRTDKDYDTRTCTLDLDAPPEGLQQLLERLGVVLVPLGL